MPGFLCRWWNIDLRSSMLCSQCPYWSSHLLRLICWWLWPWFPTCRFQEDAPLALSWFECELSSTGPLFEPSVLFGKFWNFGDVEPLWRKFPPLWTYALFRYSTCQSILLLSLLSATRLVTIPWHCLLMQFFYRSLRETSICLPNSPHP